MVFYGDFIYCTELKVITVYYFLGKHLGSFLEKMCVLNSPKLHQMTDYEWKRSHANNKE